MKDLIALAETKHKPRSIRQVELELHDGRLVLEVTVATDAGSTTFVYDPATGDALGQKRDDEGADGHEHHD